MESSLEQSMYQAVLRKDLDTVMSLLKQGADPNKITSEGRTCLGVASYSGNTVILKPLLDCGKVGITITEDSVTVKRKRHKSHKRRLKRDVSSDESNGMCKNVGEQCLSSSIVSNYPHLSGVEGTLCSNLGYFVFIHDDAFSGERNEAQQSSLVCPGTPSTPSPLELEWDEEVGNVAPTTSEDETWSSLYRWYAAILECTGAALACAAAIPSGIDQLDSFTRTAAHYAAEQGQVDALKMLIDAGCKIDISAGEGLTPLHVAVFGNHTPIARLLLDAGAHVNISTNEKMTALHFAATRGYLEMVQMLVQSGASLEARDTSDRTALFLAAGSGNADVVECLISAGANVNGEEVHGYTPLCEAVWQRNVLSVRALLAAGARVTHSHRLLHNAVLQRQEEIVTLLAAAGGINIHDDNGDTPLLLAARTSQTNIAKVLLTYGANVNTTNSITGASVLHEAVETMESYEEMEELLLNLLEYGVDMNATSLAYDTALNRAILLLRDQAVTLLVRHGADVNACYLPACALDNLALLSSRRSSKLARMLIKAGHKLPSPALNQARPLHANAAQYIYRACRNPLLLTDLCRLAIRTFPRRIPMKRFMHSLPLPKRLINFLMFSDEGFIIKEKCAFN